MNIGFIGAGKVGSAFGHYLKSKGLNVIGYYGLNRNRLRSVCEFTGTKELKLEEIIKNCNYIFITTPDDAIAEVWNQIKSMSHFLQKKKIFHMSGALSSSVFEGIERTGAEGYSLHPLFPFSKLNHSYSLEQVVFTLEGKDTASVEDFLALSGIKYYPIMAENKAKYHAAAVFGSNYIVALAEVAANLLTSCGIPEQAIGEALYPLMTECVSNIHESGVQEALTGPILRGDLGTIRRHQHALGDYCRIYNELGLVAAHMKRVRNNLPGKQFNELISILGGVTNEENSCKL